MSVGLRGIVSPSGSVMLVPLIPRMPAATRRPSRSRSGHRMGTARRGKTTRPTTARRGKTNRPSTTRLGKATWPTTTRWTIATGSRPIAASWVAPGTAAIGPVADTARVARSQPISHRTRGSVPGMIVVPVAPGAAGEHQRPDDAVSEQRRRTVVVGIARIGKILLRIRPRRVTGRIPRWIAGRPRVVTRPRWRHDATGQRKQHRGEYETVTQRASPCVTISNS
jgi:hypothetical protein